MLEMDASVEACNVAETMGAGMLAMGVVTGRKVWMEEGERVQIKRSIFFTSECLCPLRMCIWLPVGWSWRMENRARFQLRGRRRCRNPSPRLIGCGWRCGGCC